MSLVTDAAKIGLEVVRLILEEVDHAESENDTATLERLRTELHQRKTHRQRTAEALANARRELER